MKVNKIVTVLGATLWTIIYFILLCLMALAAMYISNGQFWERWIANILSGEWIRILTSVFYVLLMAFVLVLYTIGMVYVHLLFDLLAAKMIYSLIKAQQKVKEYKDKLTT